MSKILFFACLVFVAGCTIGPTGKPFEISKLRQVHTGMTKSQIESTMGQPFRMQNNADGTETWFWLYRKGLKTDSASILFKGDQAIDVPADPNIVLRSAEDVAAATRVKFDSFRKTFEIAGPAQTSPGSVVFLRAFASDGKTLLYQVYFGVERGQEQSWAFYEEAFDSDGTKLPLIKVASEVLSGGAVQEDVVLRVNRDYLERAKASGLKIRLYGKRAETVLNISGFYIEGFLQKANEFQSGKFGTLPGR